MHHDSRQGRLFLNGVSVGDVRADGSTGTWGFGHFAPADGFGKFAPLFGSWSLLMHVDDDLEDTAREVLEELHRAELAIDRLRAELQWIDSQERIRLRQVTIDGTLIEWNAEEKPSQLQGR
jgi:hypothetical protein